MKSEAMLYRIILGRQETVQRSVMPERRAPDRKPGERERKTARDAGLASASIGMNAGAQVREASLSLS